ncbi:MAG: 50S ribosomal protein L3 [Cyanobacteria bacterium]|nr:50S ribosomal protein L3 [Cyanobacteriota bacterium]
MKKALLGNKIGMTQIFDESGNIVAVTLLKVEPSIITQLKVKSKDTYNSIQVGYGKITTKKLNQPKLGHLKKYNIEPLRYLKEFRLENIEEFKIGQVLTIDIFSTGELINIRGKSIGKGFSGLQKRHNFSRGPMTHGSKNHREPGSIGMGTTPGRVLPGKRMAGQLGNRNTTIKNLKIIQINSQENTLVIKGSVPGKSGSLLSIISS